MSYVYVLIDPMSAEIYIGFSNDLRRRIDEHGKSVHRGWKLVYYEAYQSEDDARRRERRLKDHGNAIRLLKDRIADSIKQTLVR